MPARIAAAHGEENVIGSEPSVDANPLVAVEHAPGRGAQFIVQRRVLRVRLRRRGTCWTPSSAAPTPMWSPAPATAGCPCARGRSRRRSGAAWLRRAPSFRADKDFDWGDRAKEAELHRYYGVPPYWGGF